MIFRKTESEKLTIGQKIRLAIGTILNIAVCTGCMFVVFVIAAQQDSDERYIFALNFIIVILQDMIVTPFIGTIVTFAFYRIYHHVKAVKTNQRIKKIVEGSIGPEAMEIQVILF